MSVIFTTLSVTADVGENYRGTGDELCEIIGPWGAESLTNCLDSVVG